MIDDISLSEAPGGGEIRVQFLQPFRYVSHAPPGKGKILAIRLQPVSPLTEPVSDSDTIERVSMTGRPAIPLSEVILDVTAQDRPELVLSFERSVSFDVSGGTDGRSVVVTITGEAKPPDSPKESKAAARVAGIDQGPERYAVNLLWTTDPIKAELLPDLEKMAGYRLYVSRYLAEDVLWYRLRLGFFDSRKEGEAFLESVRSAYKAAFVTRVSAGEEERSARESLSLPEREAKQPVAVPTAASEETQPVVPDRAEAQAASSRDYVINLASSTTPFTSDDVPDLEAFNGYRLYVTTFNLEGTVWNRLRLGFFPSREAAALHAALLAGSYPQAWVSRVSRAERDESASRTLREASHKLPSLPPEGAVLLEPGEMPPETVDVSPGKAESAEKLAARMEEARVAMATEEYRRAIQLYTKVLESANPKFSQDALEYLGLARERNGQLAHATAEYERYLKLYPKTEGAVRVQQRLDGLLLAQAKPMEKLKGIRSDRGKQEVRGSLSQFYTYDESHEDDLGTQTNRSALSSDVDITARVRTETYDLQSRFTGGYEKDFLGQGEDETRISSLYIDAAAWENRIAGRVGRQSQSTGGVLGRFDGGHFGVQALPKLRINLVGGYPVSSATKTSVDTEKGFYGLNLDIGTFHEHWDFNLFAVEQNADGMLDRRAVGGEVRYFHPKGSLFGLVDYDVMFEELNIGLLLGTLVFEDRSTINVSLDYRRSPVLTTSNALQGQFTDSLSTLRNTYDESALHDLARDRSPISRSATVGATTPVNEKLQLSGDVTLSEIGDSRASGGVEALKGTGLEYSTSFQVTGSSLIKEGDIAIVGLRYSEADTNKTYTLNLNTRYPVNREWRVNPRVRLDYRLNGHDAGEELTLRPSIRTDYRFGRRVRFELEGGGEWSHQDLPADTKVSTNYYITTGYRWDF